MTCSPSRCFRNSAFFKAATLALVLLLATTVPATFFPEQSSFAQSDPKFDAPNSISSFHNPKKPREISKKEAGIVSILSAKEVALSAGVLLFAVIVLMMMLYTFRNHVAEKSEIIERFGIVTVLITGALFLVTAGFSSAQIMPAVGLIGTIAGYILGQGISKN